MPDTSTRLHARMADIEMEMSRLKNYYATLHTRYASALESLKTMTQRTLTAAKRSAEAANRCADAASLAADAARKDAQIREDYAPTDAEIYLPVVRAARTNLKLCAAPS